MMNHFSSLLSYFLKPNIYSLRVKKVEVAIGSASKFKSCLITIGKQAPFTVKGRRWLNTYWTHTHIWTTKLNYVVSVWVRVSYNTCDSGMARVCSNPINSSFRSGRKFCYKLVRIVRKFWLLFYASEFIYI